MKAKYSKIYELLKANDYEVKADTYKAKLEQTSEGLNQLSKNLSSDVWQDKGINKIKGKSFEVLKTKEQEVNECIEALALASKKLTLIKEKCGELDVAEGEREQLGAKWTYIEGGARTLEEVNKHNSKIDEIDAKIKKIETEIDDLFVEINNIPVIVTSSQGLLFDDSDNGFDTMTLEEFIGDYSDRSKYYVDPRYVKKAKPLEVYDNTTHQIYKEGDTVEMEPGETRILTVKLPYLAGYPTRIIRTTSDGDSEYNSYNIVKARSDIDPDPARIDYVNYKKGHFPKASYLQTNYYNWIVTAPEDAKEGTCKISQTCEYEAVKEDGSRNGTPKAMTDLFVTVKKKSDG